MTTEASSASGQTTTDTSSTATGAAATTLLTDAAAAPGTQQQDGTAATTDAAGQQNAADGTQTEGDGKAKADAKPEDQVPEQYEDFAVPDGVALDVEITTEFKGLAKDLKLPQAKAQQVIDLGTKLAQRWDAKQAEAISTAVAKWGTDSQADKEFGGDKLKENLAVASQALNTFGTPELKQLLVNSGLGNHPEIIRAFYRAGKAISEDRIVTGAGGGSAAAPLENRMYPNDAKK